TTVVPKLWICSRRIEAISSARTAMPAYLFLVHIARWLARTFQFQTEALEARPHASIDQFVPDSHHDAPNDCRVHHGCGLHLLVQGRAQLRFDRRQLLWGERDRGRDARMRDSLLLIGHP